MGRRMVAAGVLRGRSVRMVCEPCELVGTELVTPAEGAHLAEVHDRLHHSRLGETAEVRPVTDVAGALLVGAGVLA